MELALNAFTNLTLAVSLQKAMAPMCRALRQGSCQVGSCRCGSRMPSLLELQLRCSRSGSGIGDSAGQWPGVCLSVSQSNMARGTCLFFAVFVSAGDLKLSWLKDGFLGSRGRYVSKWHEWHEWHALVRLGGQ